MTVKYYNVAYHSNEHLEKLPFDGVDIEVNEDIFNKATNFVKTTTDIESVKITIPLDKITFFANNGVSNQEIPICSCHIIITKLFSFCRIMMGMDEDILVECSELVNE